MSNPTLNRFELATPARVIFGVGTLGDAGTLAREYGRRALVVTGPSPGRAAALLASLTAAGVAAETFSFAGEPATHQVAAGAARAREQGCAVVLGFGGGSAIDAAKAIAALVTNGGDLLDYLEVIGRGQTLAHAAAPCLAIPTTAGAGAEVTRNAVLFSPEHRVKVSLRSLKLLPRVALVDPALTLSLPKTITASTGLDALTQLIEPLVSLRANPITDALCREGIARVVRSLRAAWQAGETLAAREDMSVASLCGGLALANAGLGAAHGFAAPLGGMFPAPHGAVCAALLPHVMAANARALRRQSAGAVARLDEVARLLTGSERAVAEDGAAWVSELCNDLQIPGLGRYGVTPGDIPDIVEKAQAASSMKANPVALSTEELRDILARAI